MKIIRQGIAEMRYHPERRPEKLGFSCGRCGCMFEALREETIPVSLYGYYGRILETAYTCCCPNCADRLTAESYFYEKEE